MTLGEMSNGNYGQNTDDKGKRKERSMVSTANTQVLGTCMPHVGATSLSEDSKSFTLHLMRKSNNSSHLGGQHKIRGSMWQALFTALHI